MKRRVTALSLAVAAVALFTSASVWEGSAVQAATGELPETGYYIATNSFPRNTVVDVKNLETDKTVRAIVAGGLDSPGLLAALSREAAAAIELSTRGIGRVRITMPADPIAFSRFTEDFESSGDPDHDPKAAIAAAGVVPSAEASETTKSLQESPSAEHETVAEETPVELGPVAQTAETKEVAESFEPPALEESAILPDISIEPTVVASEQPEEVKDDTPSEGKRPESEETTTAESFAPPKKVAESGPELNMEPSIPESQSEGSIESSVPPSEKTVEELPSIEEVPELTEKAESDTVPSPIPEDAEIVLVPAEERPPQPPATEETVPLPEIVDREVPPIQQSEVTITAEKQAEEKLPAEAPVVAPIPPERESEVAELIAPTPLIEAPEPTSPKEAAKVIGPIPSVPSFHAPIIVDLEKGKYYLQLGAYTKAETVEAVIAKHGGAYPLTVQSVGTAEKPMYRILVGPVNQGESGALLQRFKNIGYKDAFIKKGI